MYTKVKTPYVCPYCGKSFELEHYTSVNADQEPDLKEMCVSGDIFHQTCPHCHHDFYVEHDLVYTDRNHRFVIFFSKKDPGDQLRSFGEPLVNMGYRLRRCATIQEFTEKLQIFEDGLDDVAVELAKYDSFIDYVNQYQKDPKEVTAVLYQNIENGVMKINVKTQDQGMRFLIPLQMVEEEMKVDQDAFSVDDLSFPLINGDWIISIYQKVSGQA